MGHVVDGVVRRLRRLYGRPEASDWEMFLDWCGVPFYVVSMPKDLRGFIDGDAIFLSSDLSNDEIARVAFHEIGHWLLHDGDTRWWLKRPQGRITLAKFEYQANLFAELYPDWGE